MTLDLLIAIIATACAAIVIAALALSTPASAAQRIGIASVLTAWFFAAVVLAATGAVSPDGLGTPGVGIAVLLPILAIAFLTPRLAILRSALHGIPLSVLIGVNALRIFGYFCIITTPRAACLLRSRRARGGVTSPSASRRFLWRSSRRVKSLAGGGSPSSGILAESSTWSWRSASA